MVFPRLLGIATILIREEGPAPSLFFVTGHRSLGAEVWNKSTKRRKGGSSLFIYQELSFYAARQIFWRKPKAAKSASEVQMQFKFLSLFPKFPEALPLPHALAVVSILSRSPGWKWELSFVSRQSREGWLHPAWAWTIWNRTKRDHMRTLGD